MATFCALHDVEAEEREEATTVEGPGKALKTVNLDEPRAQVHLGRVGSEQEGKVVISRDVVFDEKVAWD